MTAFALLSGGCRRSSPSAVSIRSAIVTKLDLLEYLAHHAGSGG